MVQTVNYKETFGLSLVGKFPSRWDYLDWDNQMYWHIISGFLEDVAMTVIQQTQFTPLPEVLCLVISKLTRDSATRAASLEAILQELAHRYHGMQQPSEHLVYQALGSLCSEGNVFHTGNTFNNTDHEICIWKEILSAPAFCAKKSRFYVNWLRDITGCA